jgi:hemerythrin HHE cation binding domain-containing protein
MRLFAEHDFRGGGSGGASVDPMARTSETSIDAMLGEDHARLERAFDVILAGAERGDWDDLRRRWPAFERELTRHMDAEEIRIISGFGREHPREARTLLDDHARIRAQLTELGLELETGTVALLARAHGFMIDLREHAAREDAVLYPWAARGLDALAWERFRFALSGEQRCECP